MKAWVVLQHHPEETLGGWEKTFAALPGEKIKLELWREVTFPDPENTLAAVVLGGPMNVGEVEKYPFLVNEKKYLRNLVSRDTPVLGVCLGGQLLADVLGAKVEKGPKPEIGYLTVSLTDAGQRDPLFHQFPAVLPVFQWHGQGFALPEQAVALATGRDYPFQAFRHGSLWGLQFHLEVTPAMVKAFAREYPEDLRGFPELSPENLIAQSDTQGAQVEKLGAELFKRFSSLAIKKSLEKP